MLKINTSKKFNSFKRFKFFKNKWLDRFTKLALFGFLALITFLASIYLGFWGKIPTKEDLESLKQSQATEILDTNNDLIGKLYVYDRQSITKDDIPEYLINALIATEDVRFHSHNGIDNKSLLRVFFKTLLMSDESSGGGSTITMQLAKNLYGRQDYGFISIVVNKFKESIIALRIEELYSKDDIVTLYLNTVPFPGNTYGIESASEKFFNKHTRDLSISEAATLIGSLKANYYYNPRLNPEHAKSRRNIVVQQMLKYDFIDEDGANHIMNEELTLDYRTYSPNQGLAPYFRAEIKLQLD